MYIERYRYLDIYRLSVLLNSGIIWSILTSNLILKMNLVYLL